MEGFMTTKEAAEKWNISIRQVQNHCKSGRIKGVLRVGTNYLIPKELMFICMMQEIPPKDKTVLLDTMFDTLRLIYCTINFAKGGSVYVVQQM